MCSNDFEWGPAVMFVDTMVRLSALEKEYTKINVWGKMNTLIRLAQNYSHVLNVFHELHHSLGTVKVL